jgi:hypothetical protein
LTHATEWFYIQSEKENIIMFIRISATAAIIILFTSLFSACAKKVTDSSSYIGKWELRFTQGGLAPSREYAPGNGNIVQFTKDSVFIYNNHQLGYSHTYLIRKDTSYYFGEPKLMDMLIQHDANVNFVSIFMERKLNMLYQYIGTPALDGGVSKFEKID